MKELILVINNLKITNNPVNKWTNYPERHKQWEHETIVERLVNLDDVIKLIEKYDDRDK